MNLLRLVPGLAAIIPSSLTLYLMLGLAALSFAAGGWVVWKFWQLAEATAVNEARAKERDAVLIGSEFEEGVLKRARQRQEKSNEAITALQKRLAKFKPCPVAVPVEWVRNELPRAAADPAGARSAATRVDPAAEEAGPVADARDVVVTCERNRLEVFAPEADEREALRQWYQALRERYNR